MSKILRSEKTKMEMMGGTITVVESHGETTSMDYVVQSLEEIKPLYTIFIDSEKGKDRFDCHKIADKVYRLSLDGLAGAYRHCIPNVTNAIVVKGLVDWVKLNPYKALLECISKIMDENVHIILANDTESLEIIDLKIGRFIDVDDETITVTRYFNEDKEDDTETYTLVQDACTKRYHGEKLPSEPSIDQLSIDDDNDDGRYELRSISGSSDQNVSESRPISNIQRDIERPEGSFSAKSMYALIYFMHNAYTSFKPVTITCLGVRNSEIIRKMLTDDIISYSYVFKGKIVTIDEFMDAFRFELDGRSVFIDCTNASLGKVNEIYRKVSECQSTMMRVFLIGVQDYCNCDYAHSMDWCKYDGLTDDESTLMKKYLCRLSDRYMRMPDIAEFRHIDIDKDSVHESEDVQYGNKSSVMYMDETLYDDIMPTKEELENTVRELKGCANNTPSITGFVDTVAMNGQDYDGDISKFLRISKELDVQIPNSGLKNDIYVINQDESYTSKNITGANVVYVKYAEYMTDSDKLKAMISPELDKDDCPRSIAIDCIGVTSIHTIKELVHAYEVAYAKVRHTAKKECRRNVVLVIFTKCLSEKDLDSIKDNAVLLSVEIINK